MAASGLTTARKYISQVKEGFGAISDEKPRFGVDLRKRIAILLKRNLHLKKFRDFHFKRCKQYKLQLDQLQKKYDGLQNYFVTSQLLKQLDESHKEISNREQLQNLQVEEPFVNVELNDLQTTDVRIDIEEHEEKIVKAEPQYVEVEEEDKDNLQVDEPFVNASIKEHEEEKIVKAEPQEIEADEEEEEALHPCNNSSEHEVNSAEFEKRVQILNVQSKGRELRIHLCRIRPELYLQNGNSAHSESNLVCKWIHHQKGVCSQEFPHASELESHLKTDHLVAAKLSNYRCRWEECPSNGRPFVSKAKFISHLDEHVPQISNETQYSQIIQNATENPPSENLLRDSRGRGLDARLDTQGGKGPFGSLGGDRTQLKFHERTHKGKKPFACSYEGCDSKFTRKRYLEYHLNRHRGERPFKCPYDGCHWASANKTALYGHLRTHTGERPFKCTFKGCGSSFALKASLKDHWRIHNDERPFECTFPGCGMRFRQKANKWTHVKRMHTKKEKLQAKCAEGAK